MKKISSWGFDSLHIWGSQIDLWELFCVCFVSFLKKKKSTFSIDSGGKTEVISCWKHLLLLLSPVLPFLWHMIKAQKYIFPNFNYNFTWMSAVMFSKNYSTFENKELLHRNYLCLGLIYMKYWDIYSKYQKYVFIIYKENTETQWNTDFAVSSSQFCIGVLLMQSVAWYCVYKINKLGLIATSSSSFWVFKVLLGQRKERSSIYSFITS